MDTDKYMYDDCPEHTQGECLIRTSGINWTHYRQQQQKNNNKTTAKNNTLILASA